MPANETYQEMQKRHQEEMSALPIRYAFSDKQFKEICTEFNITPETAAEHLYKFPGGGFYLKTDAEHILDTLSRITNERDTAMQDPEFAFGAFLFELGNHEYHINTYQGDFDTLSAFGDLKWGGESAGPEFYMNQLGFAPAIKTQFYNARREFYRQLEEAGEY